MKYNFSLTAAYAMIPEFTNIAQLVHEGQSLERLDKSIIGREKGLTNKRQLQELRKRLRTLTRSQIEVLSEGTMDEQKHITHLAFCKTYTIYRDFITEVLFEKTLVYDNQLSELDYNSFISKKKMDHPEIEGLAESSETKVRQVIYRTLQQVGIIDSVSNPYILIPNLSTRVQAVISSDNPKWLRCFLQNK